MHGESFRGHDVAGGRGPSVHRTRRQSYPDLLPQVKQTPPNPHNGRNPTRSVPAASWPAWTDEVRVGLGPGGAS